MKKIVFGIVVLLNIISIQAQSPWVATNSGISGRFDDVCFINKDTGWTVCTGGLNSSAVKRTNDGGNSWIDQKTLFVYMRSIEFSSPNRGFMGALDYSGSNVFFKTLDGGTTWSNLSSVITATTKGICGICSVDTNITYAVGVFASPAYVIKTIDGGNTWTQIDMSAYANALVDVQFKDALNGYVTGQSNISSEGAVILKTTNGGITWTKVFTSNLAGDYLWKIQNLDGIHWYGSIEKASVGWNRIVKSSDGGILGLLKM